MDIIIAGGGKAGTAVLKQLLTGDHSLTVVDTQSSALSKLDRYDVMPIKGSCLDQGTLESAGAEDADLLIAFTGSDETNMLCCMLARHINPNIRTIIRVRDPENITLTNSLRNTLGVSMLVCPEKEIARDIFMQLQFPAFLRHEEFAKGRVQIVQVEVGEGSRLENKAISSLSSLIRCKVLVCAVVHDGKALIPKGDYVLRRGDRLYFTAPATVLSQLLRNLDIASHQAKNVMLVGGDRIAAYLANDLDESGVHVKVIENDPVRAERLAQILSESVQIVIGDGSSQELLESEGCSMMDSLVTLTGLDEVNTVVSMYGRSVGVPQVITKINRVETHALLNKLEIGTVVSTTQVCASVARYISAMRTKSGTAMSIHTVADGQVEAMEFVIDERDSFRDTPLRDIKIRENILLTCIISKSNGRPIIPDGNSMFRTGDTVIVAATSEMSVHQFNDIFEK